MSGINFPRRRLEGSFSFEVVMAGDSDLGQERLEAMREWILNEWMPKNEVWTRTWSSGKQEALRYADQFNDAPELFRREAGEVIIRLETSRGSTKLWKDWLVSRIISDLRAKFPEIRGVLRMVNFEAHGN